MVLVVLSLNISSSMYSADMQTLGEDSPMEDVLLANVYPALEGSPHV